MRFHCGGEHRTSRIRIGEQLSRRSFLFTVISATGLAPTGAAIGQGILPGFKAIPKAIWVWRAEPEQYTEIGRFAAALGVRKVLLSVRQEVLSGLLNGSLDGPRELLPVRSLVPKLIAAVGEPGWVHFQAMPRSIEMIAEIQQRRRVFDGVHLDIEPQALDEWKGGGRKVLLEQYVSLLSRIRARLPRGTPVEAALHPSYASVFMSDRTAMEAAIDHLDEAVLMVYRSTAQESITWAGRSISVLATRRVPWWFAVKAGGLEPGNILGQHSWNSFATEALHLHNDLRIKSSDYKGLAIHDYRGLRTLISR